MMILDKTRLIGRHSKLKEEMIYQLQLQGRPVEVERYWCGTTKHGQGIKLVTVKELNGKRKWMTPFYNPQLVITQIEAVF